jgi:2-C-methyl-D-erythritol 4-phosphate cytidylyltransferase
MTVIIGGGGIGEAIRMRTRAIVIKSKDFEEIAAELLVIERETSIDTIIVTSGFLEKSTIGFFSEEIIQRTVDANFIIPMMISNFVINYFPTVKLVIFSSSVVFEARKGYSVYSASKTGLEIFLRTLKLEYPNFNLKIIRNARTDTKLRWNNYIHSEETEANLLSTDEVAKYTLDFLSKKGTVMEIYKRDENIQTDIWETI